MHADYIRQGERGEQKLVMTLPIENILITQLTLFMRFMKEYRLCRYPLTRKSELKGLRDGKSPTTAMR